MKCSRYVPCVAVICFSSCFWLVDVHQPTRCAVCAIHQLALVIWKDHVFSKVKDRLVRSLLELITKERDGELINERVVAGVIQSFGKTQITNPSFALPSIHSSHHTSCVVCVPCRAVCVVCFFFFFNVYLVCQVRGGVVVFTSSCPAWPASASAS